MNSPTLKTRPPICRFTLLSFPTPQILLVTVNRPSSMNAIHPPAHAELYNLWTWYDNEPNLRCAIITGAKLPQIPGQKPTAIAFCAGEDIKALLSTFNSSKPIIPPHPPGGFAGLSTRVGKKPVISAIDGICAGGGLEIIANTDLNLCTPNSTFSLPELQIGVGVFAGGIPRLRSIIGYHRLNEMLFAGRVLSASEAKEFGLVSRIVAPDSDVVQEAISVAKIICEKCSPDSVIVTRRAMHSGWGWEGGSIEEGTRKSDLGKDDLVKGENMKEGLRAFVERRRPIWKDSKL